MDNLYVYLVIFFTSVLFVNSQDPKINGKLGEIVGKIKTVPLEGLPYQNVHEYLGIPFAKPPIGDLRFRKPVPMTSLPSSPFYAQSHTAYCPQIAHPEIPFDQQSEDCLYLNVYVPERPADKPSGHAVMVWVYGGGFQEGAARQYDFSTLAIASNIIVVTINYRVGVFGFLSIGDDNARGNYGLWDQHFAFKWVHDYIEDFGGDTERVTIAGESAGAMSVIQQALTPDNQGYFQRVIAQSGSMSAPAIDLERDGLKDVLNLADSLKCDYNSMDALMQCLRAKSAVDYLTVLKNMEFTVYFSPVVDGDLIKINPQHIAKMSVHDERRRFDEVEFFRSLDMLSGFNANEGVSLFPNIIPLLPFELDLTEIEYMRPTREEMREVYLPVLMNFTYRDAFAHEIMQLVEAQFTNWMNPNDYSYIRLQIEKLAGDTTFGVPAVEMARLHKMSSASRNFMYHFAPKPSIRLMPTPSWIPGAGHADEIPFVMGSFGLLGVGEENAWENELAIKMMTYWSNFVKSGDPNGPELITPFWPEYSMDTGDYLLLNKSMSAASARRHFYAEEANFWLNVFPDLVDAVQGTGSCGHGTFTSAASNVPVHWTVSSVLAICVSFVFLF